MEALINIVDQKGGKCDYAKEHAAFIDLVW